MKTRRETHQGAADGERRVSHLEASGTHLTVAEVRRFLDHAPDDAPVAVQYEHAATLGLVGVSRISVEWTQEDA